MFISALVGHDAAAGQGLVPLCGLLARLGLQFVRDGGQQVPCWSAEQACGG